MPKQVCRPASRPLGAVGHMAHVLTGHVSVSKLAVVAGRGRFWGVLGQAEGLGAGWRGDLKAYGRPYPNFLAILTPFSLVKHQENRWCESEKTCRQPEGLHRGQVSIFYLTLLDFLITSPHHSL